MLALGIWSFGRDASAVLVDENSIVAAIEEEKLSRSTGTGGIPRLAIARCLEQGNAAIADVQAVALPRRLAVSALREVRFRLGLTVSDSAGAWLQFLGRVLRESAQVRQIRQLHGPSTPFFFLEHHLCHAASAYFTSPFERALVLTLDECGDMRSGSVYLGEGEEIRLVQPIRFPHSLGWFFSSVTQLLGLRAHRDEHKAQWLSKDGKPDFAPAFRKIFRWDSAGLPALDNRYLGKNHRADDRFAAAILRELKLTPQAIASQPELRASLARSARVVLEEIVLEMTERYRRQYSVDSLCVAGGLFQNVFLTCALESRSAFKNIYAQPVAGNSGTALGAALLARKNLGGNPRQRLPHLYHGPGYSSSEVKTVLDNCKIIYKYPSSEEQLCADIAQLLLRGRVVAWFQGRTEFGHRALGNRSILASPFSEYVIENVNQYIKHREDFHPFALSAPAEVVSQFFDCSANCRFMASLGSLKQGAPAALERFAFEGRQVRVHAIERESNPRFYHLLHKFGQHAPAPVLVNTSFNLFGEPLVSDPREAIRSFYCAGIDAMAIGDFLIVK
jgi:carbamoyltransferase